MFSKLLDEAIVVWHVKTVFYGEPITVYLLNFFIFLVTKRVPSSVYEKHLSSVLLCPAP